MRVAFYSKYIVFHKLCKTYIFAYAKLYVLHKYMFAYAKVYTLYKTYGFVYMYMVLHAAAGARSTANEVTTQNISSTTEVNIIHQIALWLRRNFFFFFFFKRTET